LTSLPDCLRNCEVRWILF